MYSFTALATLIITLAQQSTTIKTLLQQLRVSRNLNTTHFTKMSHPPRSFDLEWFAAFPKAPIDTNEVFPIQPCVGYTLAKAPKHDWVRIETKIRRIGSSGEAKLVQPGCGWVAGEKPKGPIKNNKEVKFQWTDLQMRVPGTYFIEVEVLLGMGASNKPVYRAVGVSNRVVVGVEEGIDCP